MWLTEHEDDACAVIIISQAGGGVLYNGVNAGSSISISNSSLSGNYVDSEFTGATTSGLGGMPLSRNNLAIEILLYNSLNNLFVHRGTPNFEVHVTRYYNMDKSYYDFNMMLWALQGPFYF